jgi:integrase
VAKTEGKTEVRTETQARAFVKKATKPPKVSLGNNLYLKHDGKGRGTWAFIFTSPRTGKAREMSLGTFHLTDKDVGFAQAVADAAVAKELLKTGVDPLDARIVEKQTAETSAKKATLFRDYAKAYVEKFKASWKNPKYRRDFPNSLEAYAYPIIGDMDVADITLKDVVKVLEPIWYTKTETADRVRSRIEKILDAAAAIGLRSPDLVNPARWKGVVATQFPSPNKVHKVVHHPALPYELAPAFWERLKEDTSRGAQLLRFVILTAMRYEAAAPVMSNEINIEQGLWTIPPHRAERVEKSASPLKGIHEDFEIPLSSAALELVQGLNREGLLFPSPDTGKPLSDAALGKVVRRHAAGVPATTHGFRSTFKDWVKRETNVAWEVGEEALAHQVGTEVARAYGRRQAVEKHRVLLQAWSDYLNGLKDTPALRFVGRPQLEVA